MKLSDFGGTCPAGDGNEAMRRIVTAVLLVSALASLARMSVLSARAALSDDFQRLLRAEYAAIERADTSALRTRLADDLIWVVGANGVELTKRQFLSAAGRRQVPPPHFEVDSVRARLMGDVAIVDYRRGDRRQVGAEEVTSWTRDLDVFGRSGGEWRRSEEHTSELQSPCNLVCRLLLEKK